jgi:DNA polymerase III alpha subunit (gram-positive type)
MSNIIISFDLETSGFSYRLDSIIQISAVSSTSRVFDQYCNPGHHISSKIVKLTGIKNSTLQSSENIIVVLNNFVQFIKSFRTPPILIGTNIYSFDMSFLFRACVEYGIEFPNVKCIDLLPIFRKVLPKPHNLSNVYKEVIGKELDGAHNALIDCNAIMEIFKSPKFITYNKTKHMFPYKTISSVCIFRKWKLRWIELQKKHRKPILFYCKDVCVYHSKFFNKCNRILKRTEI